MPRRRTNAEWSAETRTSLLAAARRVFELEGYDGASVERIACAADLTKGAVYHHYKDKRALFRAVFEQVERCVPRHEARCGYGTPSPNR